MTAAQIHAQLLVRCKRLADALEPVLQDTSDVLLREMRKQAGLTDHTLKDLAKLGHPYKRWIGDVMPDNLRRGKRHWGSQGLLRKGVPKLERGQREGALGHDLKMVHVQSKRLYDNIYSYVHRTPTRIVAVVGIDPVTVPYLQWVVQGTRWMLPRDFIGRAAVIARPRVYATIRAGMNNVARALALQ